MWSRAHPLTRVIVALATAVAGAAWTGCAEPVGHPPIARIDLAPTAIPAHDGFQTVVTLDGRASADPIDDPAGAHPLTVEWEITGDEVRFEPGSHTDSRAPVVRFRGDRPATVTLTVTDPDGQASTSSRQLQLTIR